MCANTPTRDTVYIRNSYCAAHTHICSDADVQLCAVCVLAMGKLLRWNAYNDIREIPTAAHTHICSDADATV